MKVLAVSSYPTLGGAELALASFLNHRPADVDAIALVLGSGPLVERLESGGIRTLAAPVDYARPSGRQLAGFTARLRRVLRGERPDVVWAVGIKATVMSVTACRTARVPLVWHKVDLTHDATLTRPLAMAASGVISVSHASGRARPDSSPGTAVGSGRTAGDAGHGRVT